MAGERGVQLYCGQKHWRKGLQAREIVPKAPESLLLDNATGALDAESELVVQDAFAWVIDGRTTRVIAHWLLAINDAVWLMRKESMRQ